MVNEVNVSLAAVAVVAVKLVALQVLAAVAGAQLMAVFANDLQVCHDSVEEHLPAQWHNQLVKVNNNVRCRLWLSAIKNSKNYFL